MNTSAAIILMKHRDAPIFVTSYNAVDSALRGVLHAQPRARLVHVLDGIITLEKSNEVCFITH